MGRLIYSVITSLDGFVADDAGNFDWAAPDEQVHSFVNDLERPVRTYLYGRRMYDVMRYWENAGGADEPRVIQDFADLWRAADKVVYSTTLATPVTERTRIERAFDADSVRRMKRTREGDLGVGGPGLAAHAIRAGLVDEWHLFVAPIVIGSGTHYLPGGVRVQLELRDERVFAGGMVHLRYATRTEPAP